MPVRLVGALLCVAPLLFGADIVFAADQPQWGERYTRNKVSI